MEIEAEGNPPDHAPIPVAPPPSEGVAVPTFQWAPISRKGILRQLTYALAIVLGCSALGYAISAISTKTYASRTEIYFPLNQRVASGSFLRQDRSLSTQLVAMKSHAVLDPVAARFHLSDDALTKKEFVTVLQASEIIRIEVDDRSALQARSITGAIETSYLKEQPNADLTIESYLDRQIAALNTRLSTVTRQFNAAETRREARSNVANPNPLETPDELLAQSEVTTLNGQLASLRQRLDTVTVDYLQQPHVQPLTKPYVLSGPVAPKPGRAAAAGALAGIMLAAVAMTFFVRGRLKRTPPNQTE